MTRTLRPKSRKVLTSRSGEVGGDKLNRNRKRGRPARSKPKPPTTSLTHQPDGSPDVLTTQSALRLSVIAYGRVLQLTNVQIGEVLGVSDDTVTRTSQAYSGFVDTLYDHVQKMKRTSAVAATPITAKDLRTKMEENLGPAWQVLVEAIQSGDVEVAKWHVEQIVGKPSNKVTVSGNVDHLHEHVWRPERALMDEERDMLGSDELLKQLPGDVVEAEIIAINGRRLIPGGNEGVETEGEGA